MLVLLTIIAQWYVTVQYMIKTPLAGILLIDNAILFHLMRIITNKRRLHFFTERLSR